MLTFCETSRGDFTVDQSVALIGERSKLSGRAARRALIDLASRGLVSPDVRLGKQTRYTVVEAAVMALADGSTPDQWSPRTNRHPGPIGRPPRTNRPESPDQQSGVHLYTRALSPSSDPNSDPSVPNGTGVVGTEIGKVDEFKLEGEPAIVAEPERQPEDVKPDPIPDPPKAKRAKKARAAVKASPEALAVHEHWRVTMGKMDAASAADSGAARERIAAVEARLADGFTVEQLCTAVDGCKASPHHRGENERGTVYNGLTLICRSGEKVAYFIAEAEAAERRAKGQAPAPRVGPVYASGRRDRAPSQGGELAYDNNAWRAAFPDEFAASAAQPARKTGTDGGSDGIPF